LIVGGREAKSTVNSKKSNRRWLTMLAALVAISMLGDAVGLIIHYGLRRSVERGVPIAHDLTTVTAHIR
jgi:hypothetical protein